MRRLHIVTTILARIVALLSLLLSVGCLQGPGEEGDDDPTVVVLVIEALRHDYADRVQAPALARMASEGGRAEKLIPVFPSNSLPNQAAISTGCRPAKSGFVNNLFYDRRLDRTFEGEAEDLARTLLAEPLWVTASRQGVRVGAINWSGAEADRVSGLDDDDSDATRVDDLVAWLAEDGPEAPRLIMAYLDELDDVAHDEGPDSPATLAAVATYDAYVERILDAMSRDRGSDRSTLLVLGDHGMANVDRCIYLEAFLAQRGIDAYPLGLGGSANIYLADDVNLEHAKATLERDSELFSVHLPDGLPLEYGYSSGDRVGDLVLIARPGIYFRNLGRKAVGRARLPGMHGFAPDLPEMAAGLFAWGRGVAPGTRWGDVRMIDVHPTVCRLLGIEPEASIDGAVLPEIAIERATP